MKSRFAWIFLTSTALIPVVIACGGGAHETPNTPLLDAIDQQNVEVVEQHMEAGTDPNQAFIPKGFPFAGASALQLAILKGNRDVVRLLVDNGADIEIKAQDDFGGTPLHWAAFWASRDMTEVLVNAGADVNSTDNFGSTPLDAAGAENPFVDQRSQTYIQDRAYIKEFLRSRGGKTKE